MSTFTLQNRKNTINFDASSKVIALVSILFGLFLAGGSILTYLAQFSGDTLLTEFLGQFWEVISTYLIGLITFMGLSLMLFVIYTKLIIYAIKRQSDHLYFDRYEIYLNQVPLALIAISILLYQMNLNTIVAVIYLSCALCLIRYGLILTDLSVTTVFDLDDQSIMVEMCYTPVLIGKYCMRRPIERNQHDQYQFAILTNHASTKRLTGLHLMGKFLKYMTEAEYQDNLNNQVKARYYLQMIYGSIVADKKVKNQAIGVTLYESNDLTEIQSRIDQLREHFDLEYCNVQV